MVLTGRRGNFSGLAYLANYGPIAPELPDGRCLASPNQQRRRHGAIIRCNRYPLKSLTVRELVHYRLYSTMLVQYTVDLLVGVRHANTEAFSDLCARQAHWLRRIRQVAQNCACKDIAYARGLLLCAADLFCSCCVPCRILLCACAQLCGSDQFLGVRHHPIMYCIYITRLDPWLYTDRTATWVALCFENRITITAPLKRYTPTGSYTPQLHKTTCLFAFRE